MARGSKPPKGWASSNGPGDERERTHAIARVVAGRHCDDAPASGRVHASPHAQQPGLPLASHSSLSLAQPGPPVASVALAYPPSSAELNPPSTSTAVT
eukprot:scaffold3050_cov99-Isochrysis_galbana.AAC.3